MLIPKRVLRLLIFLQPILAFSRAEPDSITLYNLTIVEVELEPSEAKIKPFLTTIAIYMKLKFARSAPSSTKQFGNIIEAELFAFKISHKQALISHAAYMKAVREQRDTFKPQLLGDIRPNSILLSAIKPEPLVRNIITEPNVSLFLGLFSPLKEDLTIEKTQKNFEKLPNFSSVEVELPSISRRSVEFEFMVLTRIFKIKSKPVASLVVKLPPSDSYEYSSQNMLNFILTYKRTGDKACYAPDSIELKNVRDSISFTETDLEEGAHNLQSLLPTLQTLSQNPNLTFGIKKSTSDDKIESQIDRNFVLHSKKAHMEIEKYIEEKKRDKKVRRGDISNFINESLVAYTYPDCLNFKNFQKENKVIFSLVAFDGSISEPLYSEIDDSGENDNYGREEMPSSNNGRLGASSNLTFENKKIPQAGAIEGEDNKYETVNYKGNNKSLTIPAIVINDAEGVVDEDTSVEEEVIARTPEGVQESSSKSSKEIFKSPWIRILIFISALLLLLVIVLKVVSVWKNKKIYRNKSDKKRKKKLEKIKNFKLEERDGVI